MKNSIILFALAGLLISCNVKVNPQNNKFQFTKIHKVLGEGNFVLTISQGQWNRTTNAFYDLFRIENNKIVEHWDVIQPVPTDGLANDNGMFRF